MPGDAWLTSSTWRRMRLLVLDRDRNRCQIRGRNCRGWATQVDHIVSRADGGALFDPANLRASCAPCNGGRAADATNAKRRASRLTYRVTVPQFETRL
jgi:5-methylcytosine-specific restriction endonuclease McrA